MPKVYLTQTDKKINSLYDFIEGSRKRMKLSQEDVAKEIGASQQVFSYKMKHHTLSVSEFAYLLEFFGEDITKCIQ